MNISKSSGIKIHSVTLRSMQNLCVCYCRTATRSKPPIEIRLLPPCFHLLSILVDQPQRQQNMQSISVSPLFSALYLGSKPIRPWAFAVITYRLCSVWSHLMKALSPSMTPTKSIDAFHDKSMSPWMAGALWVLANLSMPWCQSCFWWLPGR